MEAWLIILLTAAVTLLLTVLGSFITRQLRERENKIRVLIDHLYSPDDDQFLRTMAGMFTASSHGGNVVTGLRNGDEIFPSMLKAIHEARSTICFETFIYWEGDIGQRFAEALSERARAGVAVHVLLDWFGSRPVSRELLRSMEEAGVQVQQYHEPRLWRLHHANHRTHRKLLITDGTIGFTGGVGIADEWTGDAEDENRWRDSHFRIEGPGVIGLQRAFMDNWVKVTSKVLHSEHYFPANPPAGQATCQVFQSSPQGGSDSVRLMFLMAITAAEHSIRISTAYFVPDSLALATLRAARRRGVHVEVIVPGQFNDSRLARLVSRARYGKLLRDGVAIYEYQRTMYHTKVMIIDDIWTSVGSTNFDNRSFRLNDEVNLNVYDRTLALEQIEWFEADKIASRRIEFETWRKRPVTEKVLEHVAAIFRSQI